MACGRRLKEELGGVRGRKGLIIAQGRGAGAARIVGTWLTRRKVTGGVNGTWTLDLLLHGRARCAAPPTCTSSTSSLGAGASR